MVLNTKEAADDGEEETKDEEDDGKEEISTEDMEKWQSGWEKNWTL